MAGPAASVLTCFDAPVPTWRDVLSPLADSWRESNFCHISDSTKFGGRYTGDPRPFVGEIETYSPGDPGTQSSAEEIVAIKDAIGADPTHKVVVAAMCNSAVDHRILAEIVRHLAVVHHGLINFDCLEVPPDAPNAKRCRWTEDGCEYWALIGDDRFVTWWLNHPSFGMLK